MSHGKKRDGKLGRATRAQRFGTVFDAAFDRAQTVPRWRRFSDERAVAASPWKTVFGSLAAKEMVPLCYL